MNLSQIVGPYIAPVNPPILVAIRLSIGNTTLPDGTPVPAYADPVSLFCQVQALTGADLRHVDSINLQGSHRVMYVTGRVTGAVRPDLRGGDLVDFPNGSRWLVTQVLEPWYDSAKWQKVLLTLQLDGD